MSLAVSLASVAVALPGTVAAGFALAWLLPLPRLTDRVLTGAVFTSGLVVADGLLLSVPGPWFTRPGVLALVVLEAAVSGALVARSPAARTRIATDLRRTGRGVTGLPRAAGRHPVVALLCVGGAAALVWRTVVGLVIGVRDYDGLWYHLVTALAFVHEHRVGVRVPVNYYSDAYAPNIEIHLAWVTLLWGSAAAASVAQVPFALLGALATTAVGRRWGLRTDRAVAAGAVFLLTPIVVDQLSRAYNDVAVAALMLAGLHLVAVAATERAATTRTTVATVAAAGVALGLATGGKASAVPATALAATVLLVALGVRARRGGIPVRGALTALAAGGVGLLLLGAPYYVRNILLFANPLRPFAFSAGPVELYGPLRVEDGLIAAFLPSWAAGMPGPLVVALVWSGIRETKPGLEIPTYLGWQWYVLLPCLLACTLLAVARVRRHGHFLVVAAICLAAVAIQPTAWWGRYVVYVVAPAAVAFFAVVDAMERRDRVWATVGRLATVLLAVTVLWPLHRFVDAPAGVPSTSFTPGTGRMVPAAEILDALRGGPRPTVWREPQYRWVLDTPDDTRIMVTRRSPYFMGPLYGPTARNGVFLVGEPARPADLEAMMRTRGLGYAYLRAVDPAARWALAHPEWFRVVGEGGGSVTVRLVDASP